MSNFPSVAVTVWATWSWLAMVTVAPGATVIDVGEKEKFWMVMVSASDAVPVVPVVPVVVLGADEPPPVDDGLALPPDEQAAKVSATPKSTKEANVRVLRPGVVAPKEGRRRDSVCVARGSVTGSLRSRHPSG